MKRDIDDDLVAALTRAGWSAPRIAARLHYSVRTVYRSRVRAGVARPASRKFTAEELALVEEMLADGCSLAEIARTLGRHPGVLHQPFRGRGWTREQIGQYGRMRQLMRDVV